MLQLNKVRPRACLAVLGLMALGTTASAQISDPAGDFLPPSSYLGLHNPDLDVVSAQVYYNTTLQQFLFTATMNGPIGVTPNAFYAWGVNKGSGTAGFSTIAPGVLFDQVIVFRPTTGVFVGATNVGNYFRVSGNTFYGVVPLSFIPSTGFAPTAYTTNLWPRDGNQTGNAAIADFAPNNSNFGVTVVTAFDSSLVPEPSTYALMAAGLAMVGGLANRRRRSA